MQENESEKKPFKVKRRGEDGHKVISLRIEVNLLRKLDQVAQSANLSRNELIIQMIQYGVENIEIE